MSYKKKHVWAEHPSFCITMTLQMDSAAFKHCNLKSVSYQKDNGGILAYSTFGMTMTVALKRCFAAHISIAELFWEFLKFGEHDICDIRCTSTCIDIKSPSLWCCTVICALQKSISSCSFLVDGGATDVSILGPMKLKNQNKIFDSIIYFFIFYHPLYKKGSRKFRHPRNRPMVALW